MSKYNDYIPTKDHGLLLWSKKFYGYALSKFADWFILSPQADIEEPMKTYEEALTKYQSPNSTKSDYVAKNEAKKALSKALRMYIQAFLAKNYLLTAVDRENLGLPVRDTVRTTVGTPLGFPVAELSYPGFAMLKLTIKHAKDTPFDEKANYGKKLFYGLFALTDIPPKDINDLNKSIFTRKNNVTLTFDQTDSGKKAWFCMCYENSKGVAGPVSPMFSAIIP
jgi:hypothetical protein